MKARGSATSAAVGPLEGLRVLELSGGVAGPHAARLLADYGAVVTKLEPPGGERARHEAPLAGDMSNPEASAHFLLLNTNKRSIVADLRSQEGAELARRLARASDVVVEDFAPGQLTGLGLDLAELRRESSSLVTCSITPFGQDGPYAYLPESDLVLQAMGGAMYATGHADREPLRLAGDYALWHAGLTAAYAIMLAVLRADATGQGDAIDVSVYETQAGGLDRRRFTLLAHAYSGAVARRRDTAFAIGSGLRPCRDGYINLLGHDRLGSLLEMIGRADLVDRPELQLPADEVPGALVEEIEASVLGWTMQRTAREAFRTSQGHRLLGAPVYSVADALADPTFRERNAWERIAHPVAGELEYPRPPFRMSAVTLPPRRPAPLLDEHREEVLRDLEELEELHEPSHPEPPPAPPRLPLEGVRVLDLAVVWAGPFATQLLAQWGAEILKMEPINAVQPQTRATDERNSDWLVSGSTAPPWNRGASFNAHSPGKRSFTGDVRSPEGREAFLRLVETADVVLENNVPETIERLGLTYEDLREANPQIIHVRMPGFGLSGEYKNFRCWGNHIEGMAGHLLLRAYPGATPEAAGDTYAADSIGGLSAALATVMALRHRARTGEGQLIEVPMIEGFTGLLGVEILDYQLNDRVRESVANDHRTRAPHNAYRCAREDRWIAIDVQTDAQWRSLCQVLGLDDLLQADDLTAAAGRWSRRRELDRRIEEQTLGRDRDDLFEKLVQAGVPAGPVQDDRDCFQCTQLRARDWFEPIHRDDIGTHDYPGRLFRMAGTAPPPRRPPPTLGEANEYVYRDLLGLRDEDYQRLLDAGLVGTGYNEALLAANRMR